MKIGTSLLLVLAALLTISWTKSEPREHEPFIRHCDIRWYYDGPSLVTANGEFFNPYALTYASKSDIIGTVIEVEWKGKSVRVRCNDRGPNQVELTYGAFKKLEDPDIGVLRKAKVTIIK